MLKKIRTASLYVTLPRELVKKLHEREAQIGAKPSATIKLALESYFSANWKVL